MIKACLYILKRVKFGFQHPKSLLNKKNSEISFDFAVVIIIVISNQVFLPSPTFPGTGSIYHNFSLPY